MGFPGKHPAESFFRLSELHKTPKPVPQNNQSAIFFDNCQKFCFRDVNVRGVIFGYWTFRIPCFEHSSICTLERWSFRVFQSGAGSNPGAVFRACTHWSITILRCWGALLGLSSLAVWASVGKSSKPNIL